MKDLNKAFRNPPRDGRLTPDLKTTSVMDRPAPQPALGALSKGGVTLATRVDEQRPGYSQEVYMRRFEREQAAATGRVAPNSAREAFEAGVFSAQNSIRGSGRVGQPDLRNHTREVPTSASIEDPSPTNYADVECARAGYGPIGSRRPDVRIPEGLRSDGKPE